MRVLISWIARNNDPWADSQPNGQPGTHLELYENLKAHRTLPDHHVLFYDDSTKIQLERLVAELARSGHAQIAPRLKTLPQDFTDYAAIIRLQREIVADLRRELPDDEHDWHVFLSPGPPQLATGWILLTAGRFIRAHLFQQIPRAHLAPGENPIRPVNLALPEFPLVEDLRQRLSDLKATLAQRLEAFGLTGRSKALHDVVRRIERFAPTNHAVLILGQRGVGKELVARAIHDASQRSGRFVAVSGPTLSSTIAESELFGHARGAFTGATHDAPGAFREAADGTLFLDEIADAAPTVQAKLLRALEQRAIRPLGSACEIPVSARVVAATNCDATDPDQLRPDLLDRFPFKIVVPPLAERPEDLDLLIPKLFDQVVRDAQRPELRLAAEAAAVLHAYSWPGNVRELLGVLMTAAHLAPGALVRPDDLRLDQAAPASSTDSLGTLIAHGEHARQAALLLERQLAQSAMRHTGGNKSQAAKRLEIDRKTLDNWLKHQDPESHAPTR